MGSATVFLFLVFNLGFLDLFRFPTSNLYDVVVAFFAEQSNAFTRFPAIFDDDVAFSVPNMESGFFSSLLCPRARQACGTATLVPTKSMMTMTAFPRALDIKQFWDYDRMGVFFYDFLRWNSSVYYEIMGGIKKGKGI